MSPIAKEYPPGSERTNGHPPALVRFLRPLAAAVPLIALLSTTSNASAESENASWMPDPAALMSTQRVGNGEPVEQCGFPTSVTLGQCTGTLVHPRVVLYAAHCGDGPQLGHILFSEGRQEDGSQSEGREVIPEKCESNGFNGNSGTDWAYCLLPEPIDLPITPVIMRSCVEEALNEEGATLVLAGFGSSNPGRAGTKRWGVTEVKQVRWDRGVITQGAGQGDATATGCPGDSGGPSLIRMDDGTWWGVGIASTLSGNCGGRNSTNAYALMQDAAAWVEERTGMDITPCFNDDGEWEATPECRNVYAAEQAVGHGSWGTDKWCEETPAIQFPATCGPPAIIDETPPTVSIVTPETDGSIELAEGETMMAVEITAEAEDVDTGVSEVVLTLDGVEIEERLTEAPYVWTQELAVGEYTATVQATDGQENMSTSEPVTFTVKEKDIIPPTVSISTPVTGSEIPLALGITMTDVMVSVDASDEQSGIANVVLQVNGIAKPGLMEAPYNWQEQWVPGTYSLVAVATDNEGNEETSEAVMITVLEPPMPPPPPPTAVPAPSAPPAAPGLAPSASDPEGCGCRTVGASKRSGAQSWGWLALAVGLVAGARRRRRLF